MSKTIDETNLGKYFFEVRDQKTRPVLLLNYVILDALQPRSPKTISIADHQN